MNLCSRKSQNFTDFGHYLLSGDLFLLNRGVILTWFKNNNLKFADGDINQIVEIFTWSDNNFQPTLGYH